MPNITDSVGVQGRNAPHDVAMVQFMLTILKSTLHAPYFGGAYTKTYGGATVSAITAFQHANGLGSQTGRTADGETPGLVKPGSATWRALAAAFETVDKQFRTARVTPGFNLVYVPMTSAQKAASVAGIHDSKNLRGDFREKVRQLVETIYKNSGIAWSMVPKTGGWRTFDGQEDLVSDAGFGESIHQYGYAVDLTLAQFNWFGAEGRLRHSPIRMEGMDAMYASQLFAERDKIATSLKLFNTTKGGDKYHLQNFDDDTLDSVSSLIALMKSVGPKKMNWQPQYRKPTNYLCDLGLGGNLYFVGTAVDIWKRTDRHISPADLASALATKKKADPKFSPEAFLRIAGPPLPETPTPGDIKPAHIQAVQVMLKAEFQAAADNWNQWKPVLYPNSDRRDLNPVKR
jgi:hypothetical protein